MATVTIDPNLYVKPSPALVEIVEDIAKPTQEIRNALKEGKELTVKDIAWIRNNVTKAQKLKLYEALSGCQVLLPSPVFPERNPVLEARCKKLRFEQEEREYKAMTQNIREQHDESDKPLSIQFKELNNILVMLVQFVVSVAASFVFGYISPYYLWGREDVGSRLLMGVITAFGVGVADLYFVIREHLSHDGVRLRPKEH